MIKVATLAVGTEVTDGQIVDRNSALLSQLSIDLGFEVIEHRAVPDDRRQILEALKDLTSKVQILFVTGGLGPTSDDFTREVVSEFLKLELVYDASSWDHVVNTLKARAVEAREIQKKQCYFPKGATVYKNPVGTANAFSVEGKGIKLFALPGPPNEIMAVWKNSLSQVLENLVPVSSRTKLKIWRCMGKGESDIAELIEPIVQKANLRVGYRAHAPYVEVKVWSNTKENIQPTIEKINEVLSSYIVNFDSQDLAEDFLQIARQYPSVVVRDLATYGLLSERIMTIVREENLELNLTVKTSTVPQSLNFNSALELCVSADSQVQEWLLTLKIRGQEILATKIKPIHNHKVESERGRKYICEKALQIAVTTLAK